MKKYLSLLMITALMLQAQILPGHAQGRAVVKDTGTKEETPKPVVVSIPEEKETPPDTSAKETTDIYDKAIFDDKLLIQGYAKKYGNEPLDILLAMIEDDVLNPLKMTAAIRVFREKYSDKVFNREKKIIERLLLRRYARTDSPFVQIEVMHTMVIMDRYKYFDSFIPHLIRKLDHYNSAVNDTAYTALDDIIQKGSNRPREARIIFNILRKNLFLSRKRLADVTEPDPRLSYKLKILRWSIKILGIQELKKLPEEVLNLL